jgi:hypothetical protein
MTAAAAPALQLNDLDSIADELVACRADPELFVDTMFDWNAGELKGKAPEPWQREVLRAVRDGLPNKAIRIAVASGHGTGKSCLISWICLWAISTCTDTRALSLHRTKHSSQPGIARSFESGFVCFVAARSLI